MRVVVLHVATWAVCSTLRLDQQPAPRSLQSTGCAQNLMLHWAPQSLQAGTCSRHVRPARLLPTDMLGKLGRAACQQAPLAHAYSHRKLARTASHYIRRRGGQVCRSMPCDRHAWGQMGEQAGCHPLRTGVGATRGAHAAVDQGHPTDPPDLQSHTGPPLDPVDMGKGVRRHACSAGPAMRAGGLGEGGVRQPSLETQAQARRRWNKELEHAPSDRPLLSLVCRGRPSSSR